MEETIRILVVDDEPDIRRICRILLENSGYTVLEAATGLEAVETIRRCPEIDLILMDIMMPVMNGNEATKKIRRSGWADAERIPVIAVTACVEEEIRTASAQAGINGYVTKPLNAELLIKTLSDAIRNRNSRNHEEAQQHE